MVTLIYIPQKASTDSTLFSMVFLAFLLPILHLNQWMDSFQRVFTACPTKLCTISVAAVEELFFLSELLVVLIFTQLHTSSFNFLRTNFGPSDMWILIYGSQKEK